MNANNYWTNMAWDPAYKISKLRDQAPGMSALRDMFPDGVANELNFVLFSTSGTHGHYGTIEDCEADMGLIGDTDYDADEAETDADKFDTVTFLIVHPRLVTLRYGNCTPRTVDDIALLKRLRASSWDAAQSIGSHACPPIPAT